MMTFEKLRCPGTALRLQGIMDCYTKKQASDKEQQELQRLKNDDRRIAGRPIFAYAMAVLDLLGIEAYTGNDLDTAELIQDMRSTQ
ncbi:MAG: hypothetical protein LUC39_00930 [Clostridiales bacterium]|nr:hypothetical protein [Clostridiales bacterium]